MAKKYKPEFRERALCMLTEALSEHASLHTASKHIGGLLGVSPDTLRVWQLQTQIDASALPGIATDMNGETIDCAERWRNFEKRTSSSTQRKYFQRRNQAAHKRNHHIHR